MFYLKIIQESFWQAVQQLMGNRLRSFLSLLGISIGIFCVIGVKAAINSLEDNIKGSFEKLGNDVLYLSKMPWAEDPNQNYWKYKKRPQPNYDDLLAIQKGVEKAAKASFTVFLGGKIAKFQGTSIENAMTLGVTYDYADLLKMKFSAGRWFSQSEYSSGTNVACIGHNVAEQLYGAIDPIGREMLLLGRKVTIVGVIEKTGRDIFSPTPYDDCIIISYETARKVANVKPKFGGTMLNIKAKEGVSLDALRDEVTGVIRANHKLKPREDNNFALNEISILTKLIGSLFVVLNLMGLIIGGFALVVGMFSVANIMFVSVKERTNIIGIKKALGAKRFVILLEFLIESVILCILGGGAGLIAIYGVTAILSEFMPFDIYLSFSNVINGVITSIFVGVLAGMIPAWQASKLDPVVAMRQ
jgi:putative ABC transport system permease protein